MPLAWFRYLDVMNKSQQRGRHTRLNRVSALIILRQVILLRSFQ
jgi:hypothetical protein